MSTVSYIIQVYGSCSGYLLQAQVQQNFAVRYACKLPFYTPTQTLLDQCGWLSIRKLVAYHSLILLHKVIVNKTPQYIYSRLKFNERDSRTSDNMMLVENRRYKTATASRSFLPRTIKDWNKLPIDIRSTENHVFFKKQVKIFIKDNIPIK